MEGGKAAPANGSALGGALSGTGFGDSEGAVAVVGDSGGGGFMPVLAGSTDFSGAGGGVVSGLAGEDETGFSGAGDGVVSGLAGGAGCSLTRGPDGAAPSADGNPGVCVLVGGMTTGRGDFCTPTGAGSVISPREAGGNGFDGPATVSEDGTFCFGRDEEAS